jgi:[NiFe] hydrogenase assembly HybE family chaperone
VNPGAVPSVDQRARALQARFEHIAATRMAGLPMLHPGLRVRALGFEPAGQGTAAWGVLLTPWFMNLVWLPDNSPERSEPPLRVGDSRRRVLAGQGFDFIGAFEDELGAFEACSLFSPMAEFVDQAAAEATALAVLQHLRPPPQPPQPPEPSAPAAPDASRRALLFGRRSPAGVRA